MRVILDTNSDAEILGWFLNSAISRMGSYQTYIGHIESGVLYNFITDWHTTISTEASCHQDCHWQLGEEYCMCRGSDYCHVTSDFREDYSRSGCSAASSSCGNSASAGCRELYDDYISAEIAGQNSINSILEEMKVSLQSAISIFGKKYI